MLSKLRVYSPVSEDRATCFPVVAQHATIATLAFAWIAWLVAVEMDSTTPSSSVPVFYDTVNATWFRETAATNGTGWLAFPVAMEALSAGTINVRLMLIMFAGITMLSHVVVVMLSLLSPTGTVDPNTIALVRWLEYTVSATIMKIAIDLLCGVRVVPTLVLDAGATMAIMLTGIAMDSATTVKRATLAILPSLVLTVFSWYITVSTFLRFTDASPSSPPDFVVWVIVGQGVCFNLFGVWALVDLWVYQRKLPERVASGYIVLSAVAKTLLVSSVNFGLM